MRHGIGSGDAGEVGLYARLLHETSGGNNALADRRVTEWNILHHADIAATYHRVEAERAAAEMFPAEIEGPVALAGLAARIDATRQECAELGLY
ncbi:MAG TPA: hypothetical protein VJP80_03025 [Candidatus Saccharimonadales bacterium]|nr:hypothetical protein [Candidatus Saccharimonadales bacterium]